MFKKEGDNLIITIPLTQRSYDALGDYICDVPNIIAVIDTSKEQKHSISYLSDLGYKGTQQIGSTIMDFSYDKEELEKVAKEIGLDIWYI